MNNIAKLAVIAAIIAGVALTALAFTTQASAAETEGDFLITAPTAGPECGLQTDRLNIAVAFDMMMHGRITAAAFVGVVVDELSPFNPDVDPADLAQLAKDTVAACGIEEGGA